MAPGQVFGIEVGEGEELKHSGWVLFIHPDFLWKTPLAKTIKQYEYFDYSVNEPYSFREEETTITGIIQNIEQEYHSNIDKFSQNVNIAQLELLLTYAERFYQRQFITRKITNHKFSTGWRYSGGIFSTAKIYPEKAATVQYVAEKLNISPNY